MTQNALFEKVQEQREDWFDEAGWDEDPSKVTFLGNSYDLTSLGALASSGLLLFLCVTCNMGFYCLPVLPLLLGIVGVVFASESVDQERTRTWSWIGLGTGAVAVLLILLCVLAYIALFVLAIVMAEQG